METAPAPRNLSALTAGQEFDLGSAVITANEIVEFAADFDPAPFHLSERGGRDAGLGGLIASGWQSCAIVLGLLDRGLLAHTDASEIPSIKACRWLAPVRPDDRLSARAKVISTDPAAGVVFFHVTADNAAGMRLVEIECRIVAGSAGGNA
jgi:acyl dehydratase